MTELIDIKTIYNDFKYFKSIYTQINIDSEAYLIGQKDYVELVYDRASSFYILTGKLFGDIELLKWLKTGKTIKVQIANLVDLGKVLKKNVISIQYDDNTFIYEYKAKDTEEIIKLEFTVCNPPSVTNIAYTNQFKLDKKFFESDICEIFNKDGKLTEERTSDKIIEIPTNRILSIVKDGENTICFTNKNELGQRYVSIISLNNQLGIELCQEFLTI
jgi:hypothetical protein